MSGSTSQDQQQQPRQAGHGEQAPVLLKPPRLKKQTRRRVHTSRRPYQERLLNMAEARREIVTALRIHRANMRQQSKYQLLLEQRRQQPRLPQQQPVLFQEQSQAFQGVPPVPMSYYDSFSSSNNQLCSSPLANSISAGAPAAGNYNSSSSMRLPYHLAPLEEEAPAAAAIGGGQLEELLDCSLPAQPPGLNHLSFQNFGTSLDNGNKNGDDPFGVPLIQSSSRHGASSYSAYSSPVTAIARGHGYSYSSSSADAPAELSQVLGGDGEGQGMELMSEAATNAAAASAWWTKILESLALDSGGGGGVGEGQGMELMSEAATNAAAASAWWTKILESLALDSGGGGGVGEGAGLPQLTSTGPEAGVAEDVVTAVGWPEWQWLRDGVGVEREVEPAGILETVHVDDGDYIGCYEGGDRDNGGGHDLSFFPCMDIVEGWDDDGEWFP